MSSTTTNKVLVIGKPRPNDPEEKREAWLGLLLTVCEPQPKKDWMQHIPDTHLWVDFEEVIAGLRQRGQEAYAAHFERIRQARMAPGLLIEKAVCQFV